MNRFFRILFFIIGAAVSLEIFLRLFKPDALEFYRVQKQVHKLDPDYLVDLEPNQDVRISHFLGTFDIRFSTNEKGFRGTDPIDNSRPQILCIGDSVAMGFGVSDEDTFCRQFNGFQDRDGNVYQSVNLAVDAYGPSAILRKLKKHLPSLNPKILFYFPSNGDDIDEEIFYSKLNSRKARLFFETQFLLAKHSYLFLGLRITQEQIVFRLNEMFIYPLVRMKNFLNEIFSEKRKMMSLQETVNGFLSEFKRGERKDPNSPPVFGEKECLDEDRPHPIPETVYTSTREIIKLAQEKNVKLVFVVSPIDIETAYCSQQGKLHRLYTYSRAVRKFLEEEKVDFIDMNDYAVYMMDGEERFNVRPFYIIGDGHYTKAGNSWMSAVLLLKLRQILGEDTDAF
ncbi:MAG TPA: hypothetical protein PL163_06545 [Leptospiraceae bacterium]|nr:hypothetical protein [Leptospiraceae bacterium]